MIDLEFTIDFKSQQFVDNFIHTALYVFSVLSVIIGFYCQQLLYTIYSFAVGILLVLLVVLPSYPFYKSHPVQYLTIDYVKQ